MASGAHPGFPVRGKHLKKIAPSGGRRENVWGISCEKSRFYAKISYFFQFWGDAPGCAPPPGSAPGLGNQAFTKPVEWAVTVLWVSICLYFYDFSTGFWKRSDGMVRYYLFFHLNFNFNMFMKFNASILLKYCQRRH